MSRLKAECVSCIAKKYMEKYPEGISEEQKRIYVQRVLKVVSEASPDHSGPVMVYGINQIRKEMFGIADDYEAEKHYFNEKMLACESDLEQKLEDAQDSLKLAIQYALTGNYIDFGAMKEVDESYLMQTLEQAHVHDLKQEEYDTFRMDLQQAKRVVYLTDNCGEVVLDKLLIKTIQKLYPQVEITVIVRGDAVLNDATIEDAKQIGLADMVRVIGNGNGIAGTWLNAVSEEAKACIEQADVLIAKGQANFETLQGCGKNIYYLFLCKCDMFVRIFDVPKFSGMFINEKRIDFLKRS